MPTTATAREIRADFDRIARLLPVADRLGPYEPWLLENLPTHRGAALEIGCGVGHLTRRIVRAFDSVVAIDFSENMIAEAIRRTSSDQPIEYVCTDMFEWLDAHPERYDCIITVATLHHVDLRVASRSMSRSLKRGGTLLVIDLLRRDGWRYFVINAAAQCVSLLREVLKHGRLTPWGLRRAYWQHGRKETYLSIEEVKSIASSELPGGLIQPHLLWRYTLTWHKP